MRQREKSCRETQKGWVNRRGGGKRWDGGWWDLTEKEVENSAITGKMDELMDPLDVHRDGTEINTSQLAFKMHIDPPEKWSFCTLKKPTRIWTLKKIVERGRRKQISAVWMGCNETSNPHGGCFAFPLIWHSKPLSFEITKETNSTSPSFDI